MIELKVTDVAIPSKIAFNYDELKNELAATMQRYETMVYTADQMKAAKADKASLNKLKKALNDERIRREREYMAPFNEFKAQIAELIALIDKPVMLIDRTVKEYEEEKKAQKRQQISEYFESMCDMPEWLKLDQVFNPSWLNASYSMKNVENDLNGIQEKIAADVAALSEMPAFAFEATEVYKQTLNIQTAINEGKRLLDIQQRKEEAERMRAESEARRQEEARIAAEEAAQAAQDDLNSRENLGSVDTSEMTEPIEEPKQWISFRALLTVPQAKELRAFFVARGIEFKAI